MKLKCNKMKTTIAIITFALVGLNAFGQDNPNQDNVKRQTNDPYWMISKDVQKLQFSDAEFVETSVNTGYLPVSKGVQLVTQRKSSETSSAVRMSGSVPSHVISKGVARMQVERSDRN